MRDNPASSRLVARTRERRTSRAWMPRLWTLVAISLFPAPPLAAVDGEMDVDVVKDDERVGVMEEGAYALSAASMWVGVTATMAAGVFNGLSSVLVSVGVELEGGEATARSIAPLRTSNKLLTSPVNAATFFVRSVIVGVGRNFFALASPSSLDRGAKRDWRIRSSCAGV